MSGSGFISALVLMVLCSVAVFGSYLLAIHVGLAVAIIFAVVMSATIGLFIEVA